MFDTEDFESLRLKKEILYKTFGEVYCPYFKEKVIFNSVGLEHLKFKRYDKPRSEQDQYMRFKLLHLAPEIIKKSYTLQGYKESKRFERLRKNNRTETILRLITYYEFIAVIKRDRVRIIIKQIENGPKVFLSIIPYWNKGKENTRFLLIGDPEQD